MADNANRENNKGKDNQIYSEYPQCPICYDIYSININDFKAPKVLDCGDSICKECLKCIIKKDETNFFNCPLCNTQIKKKDLDNFITNKQIIKLTSYFLIYMKMYQKIKKKKLFHIK